jgi:hypothetical protein
MKGWIVLALALFLSGCLTQPAATATPIYEVPKEEPYIEPSATPTCQPFPGVTFEVRHVSGSMIELQARGLESGETPSVIYSTFSNAGGTLGEERFMHGADERGEFSASLSGFMPLEGQTSATWDIRFIHSRGVECATITFP